MASRYLKGSAYGLEYGHRIVKDFGISIKKEMVKDYWIASLFKILGVFEV